MRLIVHRSSIAIALFLAAPLVLTNCSRDPATLEAKYLKRGKALMEKKDYSRAILEFSNAAKAMPRDPDARYQLGLAYLSAKRTQQAFDNFRRATELNPNHVGAQQKFASILLLTNDPTNLQDAERRLSGILSAASDNPDVLSTLAVVKLKLGKLDEGTRGLEDALKKFPAHLATAGAMAVVKLSQHDVAGAEAVLKNAAALAPKSADVGMALAQFYRVLGKPAEAEKALVRVLEFEPAHPRALTSLAELQEFGKRFEEAETTYRKLAALKEKTAANEHASFLLRRQRYDEAVTELRKLSEANPHDRVARTLLIDSEMRAGKIADAERDLQAALKKNPRDTDALLQRSRLLLAAGRVEEAEKDLRFVLDYQKDSAEAHYALSRIYAFTGADTQRRDELADALRLQPTRDEIRVELAKAMIASGAPKAALELMDAAPPQSKKSAAVIAGRNWALLALQRLDEVAAGIEEGSAHGRTADLAVQHMVLLLMRKDYATVETEAVALLQAAPGNVQALNLLMQSYAARKQPAAAERRLREVAKQKTPTPDFQLAVGRWLMGLGKLADARTVLEASKALHPGYPEAELELARLDQMGGDSSSARTRLIALTKAQPRYSVAWLSLANLEFQARNLREAQECYRKVTELDRRNLLALNNYAYLRAGSDPEEALKFAERALEMAPENAEVLDTLAWVYYRKGLYERAVTYLERAMERGGTPLHQFHLGVSLLKCGRAEAGNRNLAVALKKDPTLTEKETGW